MLKTLPPAYIVTMSGRIFSLMTLHFTHAQSILIFNIIMFANRLKLATFTMHISPPTITLLIVSPNLFHAQNSKNSQLIWACTMTFQLEGGCWKWASGNGHYHPAGYGSMWTHICSSVI